MNDTSLCDDLLDYYNKSNEIAAELTKMPRSKLINVNIKNKLKVNIIVFMT